ncbi:hypothetical protein [Micromonospora sp. NPDC003776]
METQGRGGGVSRRLLLAGLAGTVGLAGAAGAAAWLGDGFGPRLVHSDDPLVARIEAARRHPDAATVATRLRPRPATYDPGGAHLGRMSGMAMGGLVSA